MLEDRYNSNKTKLLSIISLIAILLMVLGATFAYFTAQSATPVTRNVTVTTHTVDTLTFSITDDIEIEATQQNFSDNDNNISDETTATAVLTPNSKTGSASKNYYLYLNLPRNDTLYSSANTSNQPELLLQVFDGSNNLVTLTGLGTQKTVGTLTGYDITGKIGLYALLNNHEITASNNTATIEPWRVVITLINHDFLQNDNTGKRVIGSLIVSETATTYCDVNPNDDLCNFTLTYNPSDNVIELENGYLYHHDENLTNGANDNSWRYAGTDPNNYVCFGSTEIICPEDNIYRIIGKIPVDVVTNDQTVPVTTERQVLYKLIKNEYETTSTIGMNRSSTARRAETYYGPSGNQPNVLVDAFHWTDPDRIESGGAQSGYSYNHYNTWGQTTLNTIGLNTNVYNTFNTLWQEKIAKVIWKVGGADSIYFNVTPMSTVYNNEILSSGVKPSGYSGNWYVPRDGIIDYPAKIGLMYVSDYGYAAPQSAWNYPLYSMSSTDYSNNTVTANNWIYKGIDEWTITRSATGTQSVFSTDYRGFFNSTNVYMSYSGLRRVFYLTEDAVIDMTNHAGTLNDPFVINNNRAHSITNNNDDYQVNRIVALPGETVNITNDTYTVGSFKLNNAEVIGNSFTMPNEDVTITDITVYTITDSSNNSNIFIVNSAVPGDTIEVNLKVNQGYTLQSYKVNGTTTTNSSFTMPSSNVTITDVVLVDAIPTLRSNSDYKILEYIQSNGSQYINTGVVPTANTDMEIDFTYLGTSYNGTWTPICGVISQYFTFWVNKNSLKLAASYGSWDPESNSLYPIITTSERHTMYNRGRDFYLDGNLVETSTSGYGSTSNNIYIFAYGGTTTPGRTGTYMRVYSFKVYESNTLIRYMVPVIKRSTGEAGMYDVINNQFYPNNGTGKFIVPANEVSENEASSLATAFSSNAYFTKKDYLTSSGTQHIKTLITPSNTRGIYARLSSNDITNDLVYFGSQLSVRFWIGNKNGKAYFGWNTDTLSNDIIADQVYTYKLNYLNDKKAMLDNSLVRDFKFEDYNTFNSRYLYIFAANTSGASYNSKISLYELRITNNNKITNYFIPAERNLDNVLGLYDVVNDIFYVNEGSGSFSSN